MPLVWEGSRVADAHRNLFMLEAVAYCAMRILGGKRGQNFELALDHGKPDIYECCSRLEYRLPCGTRNGSARKDSVFLGVQKNVHTYTSFF